VRLYKINSYNKKSCHRTKWTREACSKTKNTFVWYRT